MKNLSSLTFGEIYRMTSSKSDLKKKFRSLFLARFGMFILVTGAVFLVYSAHSFLWKLLLIYGTITLGYLLTMFWWEKTAKEISLKFICSIQLLFELIVEAGIIHFSGGVLSPFIILFWLSIITSGFIYELTGTLITATGAVLAFAAVVILEFKGLIGMPTGVNLAESIYHDSELLFFTVYIYACFMYLTAFLVGFLSGKLKIKMGELEEVGDALRKAKMDTDDILMHMNSGLLTLNPEGNVVYFNKAAGELLGIEPSSAKGEYLMDILPKHSKPFGVRLSELLDLGGQIVRSGEFSLQDEQGNVRTMHLSCSFLVSPDGGMRGIIALFEDITESKRRETYLHEMEKMATLGELSANLAHEIRNPLAAIRASVETLSEEDHSSDISSDKKLMSLITKETDRLTRVLDEFLVFARIKELPADHITYNRVDLGKLVDEVTTLAQQDPAFGKDKIIIENKLSGTLFVLGREDQLKDVFYNLIINAKDSLGEKGKITIAKAKEQAGFYAEKRLIGISITDDGPGIPEEYLNRIFTPFFSTKARGTGLGLAISQGIVNRHSGIIEAENIADGGARFTVYLLKAPEKEQPLSPLI